MKKIWLVAALAAFASTQSGGCHNDDDDDDPASSSPAAESSSGDEITYSNGHPIRTPTSDPTILSAEEEMMNLTNSHRVANGLSALTHDTATREVARANSKHMVVHVPSYFAHANPEGDGPGARLSTGGVGWWSVGENIAGGYVNATSAFNAWLNSPGHRANLENPNWTHTGQGYWFGGGQYFRYYTQLFLIPQ